MPAGEREAGEQRAAGATDAERHREREPDEAGQHGRAVVSVNWNENMPSIAPPIPAMAAERAKIMTFDRFTAMPDASAATSELRTASVARPDDERISAWTTRVSSPNTDEEQQDLLLQQGEVHLRAAWATSPVHSSLWTRRSLIQFRPGMSSVGARIDQPLSPLRIAVDRERHQGEEERPRQACPSAKFTPPSRMSGSASSAPSAAAASAPITTAQKKLIWPFANKPGMFDAEVVRQRPAGREATGGHEARLHRGSPGRSCR